MKILLLGSGGREHALAWKILQSPLIKKLYVSPGNPGTQSAGATNVLLPLDNFTQIEAFCNAENINLVICGPEVPLAEGIADYLTEKSIHCLGPGKQGAKLESSKSFAKEFMLKNNIPTAAYKKFTKKTLKGAQEYIKNSPKPIVLKADGLAAGKGVIIAQTNEEALAALATFFNEKTFGKASQTVVIEQFLDGVEFSFFILTDGSRYAILPPAKDYKKIGENHTGPNTGGMGAVSPVPFLDKNLHDKVINEIVEPTLAGLKTENIDYKGFIFFGLINTKDNVYVIEYNCRLGDPETQVLMPRIANDLVPFLYQVATGHIKNTQIEQSSKSAVCIVLAAEGYPNSYPKGTEISIPELDETLVFHAGTQRENDCLVSNGGRVLNVVSRADKLKDAMQNCVEAAEKIQWKDKYFRKDIGQDLL